MNKYQYEYKRAHIAFNSENLAVYEAVKKLAKENNRSLSAQIVQMLSDTIKKRKAK